ncbi:antA/AntB antirepressor family protein [Clostridium ganghwense]|uniref:AntA/AntB antirepressor family protein n=1 Tax=Clostridium ganghwense TaxID=312089 RepID=A0ABT4CW59_9CLOT|nr:antA/AntB antirepressor family protein [Clostridium ganghwense]MCY6372446.1 antA/AntB antirepressor family protein [Clostridium ganghwense]
MRTVKINDAKVRVFQKKELIEKLNFTEDEAKFIMKYQKTFPELLQDGVDGFVIDVENLWEQLDKPNGQFSKWANKRIKEVFKNGLEWGFSQIRIKDGRPKQVIKLTLETAKHVAMSTGLDGNSSKKVKEKGKLVRSYFILMEKALRNYEYWTMVREPQKKDSNNYVRL